MKDIILFGMPGSGKGTQAELLVKKYGYIHLSSGQVIRQVMNSKENHPLKNQIKEKYNQGIPQSDELINQLIEGEIIKINQDVPIIFDSYPISKCQAEFLSRILALMKRGEPKVIIIKIPDDEITKRLSSRLVCGKCGKPSFDSREQNTKCRFCGGVLSVRSDDRKEVILNRISEYRPREEILLSYYKNRSKVTIVNGMGSVLQVANRINEQIKND